VFGGTLNLTQSVDTQLPLFICLIADTVCQASDTVSQLQ